MGERIQYGQFLHGGDYNPEQWLDQPEILKKDLEFFKKAKINTVTLGVFSWASLEPSEGEYQLEWLERIVDDLYHADISVILATPSGARPKWLADKYPEVLRVDDAGRRARFGGRHNHCYTSPVYREKVRAIDRRLASRLGGHPGVILWHVSNEFGGDCHCVLCQKEFREWLKKKYGTIDRLNDCWCTAFWSHTYQSFNEIEGPSSIGESMLHGLNLDWRRFVTDRTVDFFKWEVAALRDGGGEKPVTTNFMYDFKGLNYFKFRDAVDVVSWDSYPKWHKGPERLTASDCGMQHDLMRSIGGKPFLLMESSPSSTNWQEVSKLRKPGMHKAASLQAVAHGSDSVLYFQMRQSRGASEKFHGAVIDHYGGDDTRVMREVAGVGEALEALKEAVGTSVRKQAAILSDMESRWAMEDAQGPRNQGLYYKEQVGACYRAVRSFGINVDVIDMEQELRPYRLVIAPMAYLFRAGIQEKIREFVRQGGVLVMTYWSGVVDEYDRCFLGETPNGITDVLGLRFAEIDGLYDDETNTLVPVDENPEGLTRETECRFLCELIKPDTARTIMTYKTDFYAGEPAVTCNEYGKGRAYYICAHVGSEFYRQLLKNVIPDLFLQLPVRDVPDGVEVYVRETAAGADIGGGCVQFLFIQNFNRKAVSIQVDWKNYETVYGEFEGVVGGFDTVVLKRSWRE